MYALPVHAVASHAVLPPEAVEELFGAGYRLRGPERVEIVQLGRVRATVAVGAGTALRLVLDALDREGMTDAPVRLAGPKGAVTAPAPEAVAPRLGLPAGLRSAWGLAEGASVSVRIGPLALTGVTVADGDAPGVWVDRAVVLAAGSPGTARWLPEGMIPEPGSEEPGDDAAPPFPRVVTENDVRRARMRRETIRLVPGQKITPAARALGRELKVLDERGGP
jgi:hypothetical protein